MKRTFTIIAVVLAAAALYGAITNIVVTVPVPDAKYTNLVAVASNQNMTVESFLAERATQSVNDQWFGTMLDLWTKASLAQQVAAMEALRTPPPPAPPPP